MEPARQADHPRRRPARDQADTVSAAGEVMTRAPAIPYRPTDATWPEIYEMLCGHCARQLDCAVLEAMIALKDGAPWPDGGWVHDIGAGVSCLSYETKPIRKATRQLVRQIRRLPEERLPPVCGGCAARKGTDASACRHTRKDFTAAVRTRGVFRCHETGELCGGWCRAIRGR